MALQAEFVRKFNRHDCNWKTISFDFVQPTDDIPYEFLNPVNLNVINSEEDDYGNIELQGDIDSVSSYILENNVWIPSYVSNSILIERGQTRWIGRRLKAVKFTYANLTPEEQNQFIHGELAR